MKTSGMPGARHGSELSSVHEAEDANAAQGSPASAQGRRRPAGTTRAAGRTGGPLEGLSTRKPPPTDVSVIWKGGDRGEAVPYRAPPGHRAAVYFARPMTAPRAVDASATFVTDMPKTRFIDASTTLHTRRVGELTPTLDPQLDHKTFDSLFAAHTDNRGMALLDWARSTAGNPGQFSDITRIAVLLAKLLDFRKNGQLETGQAHYFDVDDMDNLRRLTQGVADKIEHVPDNDALGGIKPEFEGLPVRRISDVLDAAGLVADHRELEAIAAHGARAAMLNYASKKSVLLTNRDLNGLAKKALDDFGLEAFEGAGKDLLDSQFDTLLRSPEGRAYKRFAQKSGDKPFRLSDVFEYAGSQIARHQASHWPAGALEPAQRNRARSDVARAMILGPFRQALRNGKRFEQAAKDYGLDSPRFAAAMLAVAKQENVSVPKIKVPTRPVAVWRFNPAGSGTQERTEDYRQHRQTMQRRARNDLSPDAQREHMEAHFGEAPHAPGFRAWEKKSNRIDGHQSTLSAVGEEGIEGLEATAYRMARNVFIRNVPGNVKGVDKATVDALLDEPLKRFDAIARNGNPQDIRRLLSVDVMKQRATTGGMTSAAEWARLADTHQAGRDGRIAGAYMRAQQADATADGPASSRQRFEKELSKVEASAHARQMMASHRTANVLSDTGPMFFERQAEHIPNGIQLTTGETNTMMGNLFGVDGDDVKREWQSDDNSWR